MSHPEFKDLHGQRHRTSWDKVFSAIQRIDAYFKAIGLRFFEREDVIRKIMFAFMLRQHVLMDGPTGAAKSLLTDTIFGGIEGAVVWSMDLTRYTTDAHLFGAYDMVTLRERGQYVHMTEGSIAEANFAKTGEFLDAADPTLRTLLGVFNERVVRRGAQVLRFPLITTIADTNFRPEDLPNRSLHLRAVVDRFLFRVSPSYVEDPRNRLLMLEASLDSNPPALPFVHLDDIVLVSGVVAAMNLLKDKYVLEAYGQMTNAFTRWRKQEMGQPLSDRRFIHAAQIMEVSAMLHGRQSVTFEDLEMTLGVLTYTDEEREALDSMRQDAISHWNERAQRRELERELHDLQQITNKIPHLDVGALSSTELDSMLKEIASIQQELRAFTPKSIEVGARHLEATRKIHEISTAADMRRLEIVLEQIPLFRDNITESELMAMKRQAGTLMDQLTAISPRGDAAIIKHSEAAGRLHQLNADLELRFTELGRAGAKKSPPKGSAPEGI